MRLNWLALGALLLVGCAGDVETAGIGSCISENPPDDPFDVGDVVIASPPPGSGGPVPMPPSAASIAAECQAEAGTGCDVSSFISKGAASCIATLNQFEVGLEPWKLALVYHHRFSRVVWNVTSTLRDNGADGYSGAVLTLDATDGAVLGQSSYSATP